MVASHKRHGWRATLGTGLIALIALGGAQAANAQPTIDPDAEGSITVHKHQQSQDPSTTEGTGLVQNIDTSVHPPLQNIEFTARSLDGIDLGTNQGWQDLSIVKDSFDPYGGPDYGIGESLGDVVGQGTTGADGSLTFDDLPVGAYVVEETDWSNPLDANGDPVAGGITPSLPFVITVPMTHPTSLDTWLYDLHVYPKNAISTVTKTLEDSDAVSIGDTVEYTIDGDIPAGVTHDAYRIRDIFDDKLSHASTEVFLVRGDDRIQLTEGTDYDLIVNGQTVDVDITGALGQLENYYQVSVVHEATVLESGEMDNEPLLFPNRSSIENDTPVEGPPITTKFGNIVLQKTDPNNDALADATFSVFLSEEDARNNVNAIDIDGQTEFTTGDDGIAMISGLRYSNHADGAELTPDHEDYRTYWIAEVRAPEGYELLANPIELVVESDSTEAVTETVVNVPERGGFELPMTGGEGTLAMLGLGLLLTAGGGSILIARKRAAAKATEVA